MENSPEARFLDFLQRKNINADAFSAGDPLLFEKWQALFLRVHEESFVMQQKFLLNPTRRRFPGAKSQAEKAPSSQEAQ